MIFIIFTSILMGFAICSFLVKYPGYSPLEKIIPKSTQIFTGVLISANLNKFNGTAVLTTVIEPKETIIGDIPSNTVKCAYIEFPLPVLPNGSMSYHSNYSGSGIEFKVTEGNLYIFFLCSQSIYNKEFQLLRIEHPEKKEDILKICRRLEMWIKKKS